MWGIKHTRVYLDWAAAAPVLPAAHRALSSALASYGNPGSPHEEGRGARKILEQARAEIARLAEVKTNGVVFTSGATEANALALLGVARAHGASGAHILYHPAQHASVIGAVRMLEAEGAAIEEIELARLATQLRPTTVLVTLDAVNSETGEVFDTLSVRRMLDAHCPGIVLHVDAAQAPLTQSFALTHTGADVLTLDAQKVGGVRGMGALLVRSGVELAPLMRGGAQEGGRRPGTENPGLAAAFACALAHASQHRKVFSERAHIMRTRLLENISSLPHMVVNEGKRNIPNIVNVSVVGRDTDYLVALLDTSGFALSTKSACESDSEEGSRAVLVMTGDHARAASTLRISWGPTTTENELARFADALARAVRFLDENPI